MMLVQIPYAARQLRKNTLFVCVTHTTHTHQVRLQGLDSGDTGLKLLIPQTPLVGIHLVQEGEQPLGAGVEAQPREGGEELGATRGREPCDGVAGPFLK